MYHAIAEPNLDVLRMFWELEEVPGKKEILTVEERTVVRHFQERHRRTTEGRFIVPLPKKPDAPHIGESRTQAVRRFCNLERSLNAHKSFTKVDEVIQDYLDLGHAEKVPVDDLDKDTCILHLLHAHPCRPQAVEHHDQDQGSVRCISKIGFRSIAE